MIIEILLKDLIVLSLSLRLANSENIIFLSLPYYGHLNPLVRVAEHITNYGHTSYIGISEEFNGKFDPLKKNVNLYIIDDFPEFREFNEYALEVLKFKSNPPIVETLKALQKLCDRYLLNQELFLKLKSFNASLAVIDANFGSNCLAIFAYRLKIPFILQGLHNQIYIHRTPWAMSIFPNIPIGVDEENTFRKRLTNFCLNIIEYIKPATGTPSREIIHYAPERPSISFDVLIRQAELYIVDYDHFLNDPLPALPHVKYIGGIALRPAKPLKGKIRDFVEASKNGIIVVSPGTLINWDQYADKMAEAFSKIKYDVVWKLSNFSVPRKNILITKWLPQNDLLAHSKTKLFITHGGNSGRYESLYHAVPIIGLPYFADQPFNTRGMQSKGFGISMDLENFTVDELVRNIKEVIENPKYKKNIDRVSEIFRSGGVLPSERSARYVNEILKYGGDHLRSKLQNIPLYEFLMLDVLAVVFAVSFLTLLVVFFLARKCFAVFCRRNKTKKD